MADVLIIGAGIGGLTLGLMLERAGMPCRIFEAAPEIKPLGVGINLLPHAMKELGALGLEETLARQGVLTEEAVFFNRFGQLIHREALGRAAGYGWPQISIHRGDLHGSLVAAFVKRAGAERLRLGWQCTGADEDGTARFHRTETGETLPPQRGCCVVGADGIHSALRKQLYPDEGEPIYSGVNMWRGVTRWPPILGGAAMIRCGWFTHAKLVIYPIRHAIDGEGRQLVNWVVEIETPNYERWNWARTGRLGDFIGPVESWHFDWLDVPEFLRRADVALEYPMVDQDPLPRWSFGRVTLLGDAAHPMYPRGSNGAGQAILDARALADRLAASADPVAALAAYEEMRREATARVVRTNRSTPPDAILGEVVRRTGDQPFRTIDEVISRDELLAITDAYKRVAGYEKEKLRQ
ncbi:MAG TPA: flavin-dependent oxidoreductase [Stellaceae bacterium]|nr:flavin-dependent oxidoreductase [Stellaceae bacterium]